MTYVLPEMRLRFAPPTVCSLLLTSLLAATPAEDRPQPTDFIRVDEDQSAAHLQTAITRYDKGPVTVDLLGAVHIADRSYYDRLNKAFEHYEVVLFELIGGERLVDGKFPADTSLNDPEIRSLHELMARMAAFLQLTRQLEVIDYSKTNFIHADLTLEEFEERQRQNDESIFGFALAATQNAQNKGLATPNLARMLAALLSGNSNALKLEMMSQLGSGDDQIAALAGENVIISDRNRKCLDALNQQIASGKKRIAVFYGAAHFPDFENRLLEEGFARSGQRWLTAWNVPKPES